MKPWTPLTAMAVVAALSAGATAAVPGLARALAATAAIFVVLAVGSWLHAKARRDPYSLEALREVHEREELDRIQEEEVAEVGAILCPGCHTEFSRRFPACPNCGRMVR